MKSFILLVTFLVLGLLCSNAWANDDFVVVKKGDNFWKIAKCLQVSWVELKKVNKDNLKHPGNYDLIYPGQKLRLPLEKKVTKKEETKRATTISKDGVKITYPNDQTIVFTVHLASPILSRVIQQPQFSSRSQAQENIAAKSVTQLSQAAPNSALKIEQKFPPGLQSAPTPPPQSESLPPVIQTKEMEKKKEDPYIGCDDLPKMLVIRRYPFSIVMDANRLTCEERRRHQEEMENEKKTKQP